jgi:hypothetical protein
MRSTAAIDPLRQVDGVPDKKALSALKEAKRKLDGCIERLWGGRQLNSDYAIQVPEKFLSVKEEVRISPLKLRS